MIESQTKLPAQESGPGTLWDKGRRAVRIIVERSEHRTRTLAGSELLMSMARFVGDLTGKARLRAYFIWLLSSVRSGIGDSSLLSRFALHLVVVLLAVAVVAISQFSLPHVDFLLPTPTPAPELGEHMVTTPPTNRRGSRFASNNNASLFQIPVPHTIRAEHDRMEIVTYNVQANDNVWAIAQGFGLKPETVLWANPALEKSPDLLHVGQELTILPVDGIYYTVQNGDTVEKLAKEYETSVEKIVSFELNGLEEPYVLTAGQKLVLPDGRKKVVPSNYYPMTRVYRRPKDAPTGSGRFAWPTQGILTQRFWSGHHGIDVANRTGMPIYAADDGYVVLAGRDTWGYGNQVLIDHGNGFLTRYAHLHKVLVKAGDKVKKNQKIGTMGTTGRSTGPHLHFEIIYNRVRRNPLGFLP
ncbi:MAG: M23 family metallopeptidase [Anaerolineae bacterium]|jgi:murein DD-endopeptidase MepM/ murein hydrolase activator NlpD